MRPRQPDGVAPRPWWRARRVAAAAGIGAGVLAVPIGLVAWAALGAATAPLPAVGLDQPASVVPCNAQEPNAPSFEGTAGRAQAWVAAHPGPCWTIYYSRAASTTTTTAPSTSTTYPLICKRRWYDHPRECPRGR